MVNIVIKNINFYNRKVSIYNQAIKAFEINKATAEKKEFKINQSIAKLKHNDGYYKDKIIYLYPLDKEIIDNKYENYKESMMGLGIVYYNLKDYKSCSNNNSI